MQHNWDNLQMSEVSKCLHLSVDSVNYFKLQDESAGIWENLSTLINFVEFANLINHKIKSKSKKEVESIGVHSSSTTNLKKNDYLRQQSVESSKSEIQSGDQTTTTRSEDLKNIFVHCLTVANKGLAGNSTVSKSLIDFVVRLNAKYVDDKPESEIEDLLCMITVKILSMAEVPQPFAINGRTLAYYILMLCSKKINMDDDAVKEMKIILNYLSETSTKFGFNGLTYPLLKFLTSEPIITSEHGRKIAVIIMTAGKKFPEFFCALFRDAISICSKNCAQSFGTIITTAWCSATADMRSIIHKKIICYFFEHTCRFDRTDKHQEVGYRKLIRIFAEMHRRRDNKEFSALITATYDPQLFYYLNFDNTLVRWSSAEMFLDAYPLEMPGKHLQVYSTFLHRQHEAMLSLLFDASHVIRSLAIKMVCSNLKYFWDSFNPETIDRIMNLIVRLARDGSAVEVREAVYLGLAILLDNSNAYTVAGKAILSLREQIDDESKKVRCAFILLLHKIKATPQLGLKYYEVVTCAGFAKRLAAEEGRNAKEIVNLIFHSFINPSVTLNDTCLRLVRFIRECPAVSINIAKHSGDVLEFSEAYRIMCCMLCIIRTHVAKKFEPKPLTDVTNTENTNVKSEPCTSINESNISDNRKSVLESDELSNIIIRESVLHALLDYVSVLWVLHHPKFREKRNAKQKDTLCRIAVKTIITLMRHYKNKQAFYGILNLASHLSLSKICNNTTIYGTCVNHLKNCEQLLPHQLDAVLLALVMWKRGGDVLELVKDCIDEALRSVNLNESRHVVAKSRKVRFDKSDSKPKNGLCILGSLIGNPLIGAVLSKENAQDVLDICSMLRMSKELIKKRLEKGAELSQHLTDEFVTESFFMYLRSMLLCIGHLIPGSSAQDDLIQSILFVKEEIAAKIPDGIELTAPVPFEATLMLGVIKIYTSYFTTIETPEPLIKEYVQFCEYISTKDICVYFSTNLLDTVRELLFNLDEDVRDTETGAALYTSKANDVVTNVIRVLSLKCYTRVHFKLFGANTWFLTKGLITEIFDGISYYHSLKHIDNNCTPHMTQTICNAIITVILHSIRESLLVQTVDSFKKLPFLASHLARVFNHSKVVTEMYYALRIVTMEQYSQVDVSLVAVLCLLYTLSCEHKKPELHQLLKCVVDYVYQLFINLPPDTYDELMCVNLADSPLDDIDSNNTLCEQLSRDTWNIRKAGGYLFYLIQGNMGQLYLTPYFVQPVIGIKKDKSLVL